MITFDSLSLKAWIEENKDFLTGARIQKIQQPTRRDFVLVLRNRGETRKLYININPQYYHVCFMSKENETRRLIEIPQKPPMFCMQLRKYLENALISKVNQPPYERILEFYIETFNELSETIYLCLAVELMGKHSNVVLYNYDTNVIIGCAHNVGAEKSREREMAGGLPYVYPPGNPKEWYGGAFAKNNPNESIDNYYAQCIYDDKLKHLKDTCRQIVFAKLKKDKNSLSKMEYKLQKSQDFDNYRHLGDLIMANLYNLKDYVKFVRVFDYLKNEEINIELDEQKTLKENANSFYKLYNKGKTTITKLSEFIETTKANINYQEQILYSLDASTTIEELLDIKAEISQEKISSNKKQSALEPMELELDGCKVFIGKNNRQNDYIVSKLAKDEDFWFHTKDCAGSHVLLKCAEPTDEIILKCAELAKKYSSGSLSSKVGVIYTKRKYLRKPPRANLGYVTYKGEKEIVID